MLAVRLEGQVGRVKRRGASPLLCVLAEEGAGGIGKDVFMLWRSKAPVNA